jgi:Fe-S-cluster-containing hydrogenase component 2
MSSFSKINGKGGRYGKGHYQNEQGCGGLTMRRLITIDPVKCTGCGICELIYSTLKEKVFNRGISQIKVVSIEPVIDVGITCRFCEDPLCGRACPQEAL